MARRLPTIFQEAKKMHYPGLFTLGVSTMIRENNIKCLKKTLLISNFKKIDKWEFFVGRVVCELVIFLK